MLRNYLKIAWRNLLRQKLTSAINLAGLALGLACCLLITLYIALETSYDRQHPQAKHTYRLERTFLNPSDGSVSLNLSAVAPPFRDLVKQEFPEVKTTTSLLSNGQTLVKLGEQKYFENNFYFADERLHEVFRMQFTKGNAARALEEPYSIALSEPIARKYFGEADPIDKTILVANNLPVRVTAVYKPFPANTHVHPEALLSYNTLRDSAVYGANQLRTNFGNNAFFTYLVLPSGQDPKQLEARFPAFQNKIIPQDGGPVKPSQYSVLTLRPITDIHLNAHNDDEAEPNGDTRRVYIFSVIAVFILAIAGINYMNLSTARSLLRAREIGVRKVIGAHRRELVFQFLFESVLLTFLATLIAIALAAAALPWINRVAGVSLTLEPLLQPLNMALLLVAPVLVGLLAGVYPALFLSAFQPVRVLKGLLKVQGGLSLRKALVVLQFSISIILIIATAVVFRQLSYMQHKDLGYQRDRVVTMFYNAALNPGFNAFRNDLLRDGSITAVARTSRIPTTRLLDAMGSQFRRGDSMAPSQADIKYVLADADFLAAYEVPLVAGRNFDPARPGDTLNFLINEAATRALGLRHPADAVGQPFFYGPRKGTIIGVIRDFHFESLHQRLLPLVLPMPVNDGNFIGGYNFLSVKIRGNVSRAMAKLESTWKQYLPEVPFAARFLDARYEALYDAEQRQGRLFAGFAGMALFIACLGLLGLSVFTIAQRIREIGIRKVLGADAGSIVLLLSRDFLRPVLIGAAVAFPLAWWAMSRWLQDFAYRIDMPWWVFLIAGALAAVIAFCTVSLQALRAAAANPIKNLRTE